jgi:hypothetical protein
VSDLAGLMSVARKVEQRMHETGLMLGLTFPVHVRFATAMDIIESGLAASDRLEVAVGYVMLRDLVDEAREEQASEN